MYKDSPDRVRIFATSQKKKVFSLRVAGLATSLLANSALQLQQDKPGKELKPNSNIFDGQTRCC